MRKCIFVISTIITVMILFAISTQAVPNTDKSVESQLFGIINSGTDSQSPDGDCTVEQIIAVASRLNSIVNKQQLNSNYDRDDYINYAMSKGIIYDGMFDDYGRSIRRFEAAFVLANALPNEMLDKINDIKALPDSDPSAGYYTCALKLYNAGILTGYDAYGAFRPNTALKRSHASAMLERIINPDSRIKQAFIEYSSGESFYLIDDFIITSVVRGVAAIGSGWLVDCTGDSSVNNIGCFTNVLTDTRTDASVSAERAFYPQYSGKVTLEAIFTLSSGANGARIFFTDDSGRNVFEVGTSSGKFYATGKTVSVIPTDAKTTEYRIRCIIDIDKKKADVYIGTFYAGSFDTSQEFSGLERLHFSTTDKDVLNLAINNVHLYKNYFVNDVFRIEGIGSEPLSYTSNGDITVQLNNCNAANTGDVRSALITAPAGRNSNAHKDFDHADGIVRFESYILLPDGSDGAYVNLNCAGKSVFSITTRGGRFYCGETYLRDFMPNVWQCIHIEANTETQTALIRIDGKTVAKDIVFPVSCAYFDSLDIGITPKENTTMWFDDVEVTRLFEYDDYVPEPKPIETDYLLSMSVCNLWRNGSHYGWDYISPYDDLTPYTGYYDEGIPEQMDWEIKFLADRGFKTYHQCWYAPSSPASVPLKKSRMNDALHDGYFNAKYSDYLDFSIMWENAGYYVEDIDGFKNNIWKYWTEWYFSDERYFKIDNKPFLTIYSYSSFHRMCSNNTEIEKQLIQWMHDEIKKYGFDDIIIMFSNNGSSTVTDTTLHNIGVDTISAYSWGSAAYDLKINKGLVENSYAVSKKAGVDLLAVASIGFNITGWKQTRTPLMTISDFEQLLTWYRDDYMKRFDASSWKSKYIMFDTWNEYGEGHYLYPTNLHGFGYIDTIAKVFGSTPLDASANIVPTDNQKSRLSHLYPAAYMPLRRELFITPDNAIPEVRYWSLDFTSPSIASTISTSNFATFGYSQTEHCWIGHSQTNDPMIWYKMSGNDDRIFAASDVDYLHFRLYSSLPGGGTLYFITDLDRVYNEAKGYTFVTSNTDEFVDYYIRLDKNDCWASNITGIRFDPTNSSDTTVKISVFEFLKYSDSQRPFSFNIDGEHAAVEIDEVTSYSKDEVYVALKQDSGLLSLSHLAYEWNRFTGRLLLHAPNGAHFVFNVGSDKATVNGCEIQLKKAVTKYDGMPVVPLLFIYNNSGIDYYYSNTQRALNAQIVTKLWQGIPLEGGDAENVPQSDTFYSGSEKLSLKVVEDPENSDNHVWSLTSQPTQIWSYIRKDIKFEKGATYVVDLDVKIIGLASGVPYTKKLDFYINPRYYDKDQLTTGNKYDHQKIVCSLSPSDGWSHASLTFTVKDTYESHPDVLNDQLSFFINPVSVNGDYSGINYMIDNVKIRKMNAPFKLENGDAEGDNTAAFFSTSSSSSVSVISDPANPSNKVWNVATNNVSTPVWSYIRQNTKFEPGCTYKVEFDVKVTTLSDGSPANKISLASNPRYYDTNQLNIANKYDHPKTVIVISASDGWQHVTVKHTIGPGYDPDVHPTGLAADQYSVFANPGTNAEGCRLGVNYMIDNIIVTINE